ncbi:pyruvate kinase [Rhodobacter veldkampii DSM 11550]|uniref:Pyruvate kinase n=1 Tax=Phaeovulum veldkampii DSM 11550 TaxID=1185920 RepID=A0A2T4JE70_9RHOB|nr:pyruvate kinase [Phaeovulum veldkampii]MBK5947731.1 pyruvate kinase [Phaeovulum veldkampii DSM 11550]PTE16214.1 pyruvate kinase [Phaeovulum veldkampii DSM 11550]TDQ56136.1 pyruvate kinase [Phaeovulum veldkampii DSM 11550]
MDGRGQIEAMAATPVPAWRASAQGLYEVLGALRHDLEARAAHRLEGWDGQILRHDFMPGAANLADYLALRRHDLTAFQAPLAALGLSSLGRCEGHVRASLDAVLAALARVLGEDGGAFPRPEAFAVPQARIGAQRDALFGAREGGPAARIMVTLPPEAAEGPALIDRLVMEGADCLRINCAHDGPEAWAAMIGHARRRATKSGRRVPVLMDLAGPKLRIATLEGDAKARLGAGDRVAILPAPVKARGGKSGKAGALAITLSHPEVMAHLAPGVPVSFDDGKLWGKVVEAGAERVLVEITQAPERGARLKPAKGVNLPGVDLAIPALGEDDLRALDFVMGHADLVGYSFVQTPADVVRLIEAMEARANGRPLPAVVLKIETPLALRNLPDLIVAAGGRLPVAVMIARGDLAVEIGLDRLSEIQEEILWLCEAAHVPVVWATQVLEGLLKEGRASRAEATDAAMSQRADCVMLNKGPYLPEAVGFLRGVLMRMDRHQDKKSARLGPLGLWRDGR